MKEDKFQAGKLSDNQGLNKATKRNSPGPNLGGTSKREKAVGQMREGKGLGTGGPYKLFGLTVGGLFLVYDLGSVTERGDGGE